MNYPDSIVGRLIVPLLVGILLALFGLAWVTAPAWAESGRASYYGPGFHGHKMANGQRFDMWSATCAHKSLPFGTVVRVTNLDTGKTATCRILDRGPYVRGRIIDVSKGIAARLNMLRSGTARVVIEVLN